jgi:hypothetical protein
MAAWLQTAYKAIAARLGPVLLWASIGQGLWLNAAGGHRLGWETVGLGALAVVYEAGLHMLTQWDQLKAWRAEMAAVKTQMDKIQTALTMGNPRGMR